MMTRHDFLAAVANAAAERGPWDALEALRLGALVFDFADAVDTENATERTIMPLEYAEAVVIDGDHGRVVVHRDTYAADRVTVEARAGEVSSVLRGDELLGLTPAG